MPQPDPRQQNLLAWTPPPAMPRYEEKKVRAQSIEDRIARAVSEAMKESQSSRDDLAQQMGDYLGEPVPKNMLDAYSAQSRTEHVIPIVRFIALLHATGDQRLLNVIAEMCGWAVVDRKFVPLITATILHAKEEELREMRKGLLAQAKREGAL